MKIKKIILFLLIFILFLNFITSKRIRGKKRNYSEISNEEISNSNNDQNLINQTSTLSNDQNSTSVTNSTMENQNLIENVETQTNENLPSSSGTKKVKYQV
jgi:hypothetical protein